jgi:hypothetical protein
MQKTPPLHQVIPDFRSPDPAPKAQTRQTIQSIQFAEAIQGALAEDPKGVSHLPHFTATDNDEVDAFAVHDRHYFKITLEDQAEASQASTLRLVCSLGVISSAHSSCSTGCGER